MYGGPGAQQSEEQRKLQEKAAYDTLKMAGYIAGALWITPIIIHFVKRHI